MDDDSVAAQRRYYADTAEFYDVTHHCGIDEHLLALGWLSSLIKSYKFTTLLDVGCGTGWCIRHLHDDGVKISAMGVEPVPEFREIAVQKGLCAEHIIDGDALALPFADASVDIVCCFGILHHIADHNRAVREMCRVARKAVFISDSNNYGQGGVFTRAVKQGLRAIGLWRVFEFIRTKGKNYHISEGDGVFYSYSIVDAIPVLRQRFSKLRFLGTHPSGVNVYRSASHIAIFAQNA